MCIIIFMQVRSTRLVLFIYVLIIYSSLPMARGLLNWISSSGWSEGFSFFVNTVLIIAGALLVVYAFYKGGMKALWAMVSVTGLLILALSLERPEERLHFLEYFVLGVITKRAIGGITKQVAFVLLVGLVDEGIQYLLPQRVGDLRDVLFNAISSLTGLLVGTIAV